MTLEEYIDGARRTESSKQPLHPETTKLGLTNRMLHAIVGISTEMGEIAEAYEKSGNGAVPLDYVNLAEEVGDAYWYTAVLFDELGIVRVEENLNHLVTYSPERIPTNLFSISADMLDKTKKTMFYGKEFNVEDLYELIVRFYAQLTKYVEGLSSEIDVTKEKIWTINLNKLKIRYPEKFNLNDAEVRDLETERIELERVK